MLNPEKPQTEACRASSEFRATQQGDPWIIFIGQERFELIEAIIYGR
jgi:hypothetical protein